ncbi:hypothetical protein G6F62_015760 [Rhizopus arrhizus]|nr:hypothetical protein G6F62_015760 [Rhizopus arrhizus]
MHRPASVAATQNTGAVVAAYATSTITIQPHSPNENAPSAAPMFTVNTSSMICGVVKPMTSDAYTAASVMTTEMPA